MRDKGKGKGEAGSEDKGWRQGTRVRDRGRRITVPRTLAKRVHIIQQTGGGSLLST